MPKDAFEKLIRRVSDHYKSDIVLYIGPIERPYDDLFITKVKSWKKLDNVILILTTYGGDPHAAYRMARCLQEQYATLVPDGIGIPSQENAKGKFRLFVDTRCKSAGTILAVGASCLMFSDYGEIGPIDVQVRKGEEVGERSSVLTPRHAMESLQTLALHHFEYVFKELRFSEDLAFSTKLAADIAKAMSVGLFDPIYAQIDPMRVGEYDRAMRIASEYATRLGKGNLKDGALDKLVTGYPAHGFVIDRKEAKDLFKEVEKPSDDLLTIGEIARQWWNDEFLTAERPLLLYLTTPAVLADEEEDQPDVPNADAGNAEEAQAPGPGAEV